MSEPIMCSLTPDAIRAGRAGLLPGLVEHCAARKALQNGFRLTFTAPSDRIHRIARAIDAERQCCRGRRFELHVPPGADTVTLTLAGPAGTVEFLSALFDG